MDFQRNNLHSSSNKSHIWNQQKKLSRSSWIWNRCYEIFFPWKTEFHENRFIIVYLWMFLSPEDVLYSSNWFVTVQIAFSWNSFFHLSLSGNAEKNFMEKRFRSNDFKSMMIDSVFSADSKYEICLKTNEDYSVENPSNIPQKMSQIRY